MINGVSLDQLRTFIVAVDEGSFSAAARKLYRAQSVISDLVSNLEAQMGVQLFDRSGRYPKLTPAGQALLADARGIVTSVDFMKARAKGLSEGLEAELSVVVDVLFPIATVATIANEFKQRFPGTPLRVFVEALGATYHRVLDGTAAIGAVAALPSALASLSTEHLAGITLVMVASRNHPLAAFRGFIPKSELVKHVQLVLTDRTSLSEGIEYAVMSSSTWRLTDLFAKHAFLLSGLGWGGMPLHVVQRNIAEGELVELMLEDVPPAGISVPMSTIYRTAEPPGPAGRWFLDRLKSLHGETTAGQ
ncbi:LysR family transcriptional regulator [Pectobacterium parmentieri]|uniref:LysR family transcriptional regulator n=1 Tax=Pectobacterium parmentieri TaxID=1905730 RepID=UPI0004731A4B|nr:LysR family transcriptional regulator [Pectobacterium parmentieri]PWD64795.1 LysR family transcriptional regulator [Pectobacterium parmentieri]